VHVTQRDGPAEPRRLDRARDRTDRLVPGHDPHAAGKRAIRGRAEETDEPPGHAALPAVQNPDDHLLPHITALGEADRSRLDSRFERNRVLVHVGPELGTARFYSRDFHGVRGHVRRSRCADGVRQRGNLRDADENLESRDTVVIAFHDDHRRLTKPELLMSVE